MDDSAGELIAQTRFSRRSWPPHCRGQAGQPCGWPRPTRLKTWRRTWHSVALVAIEFPGPGDGRGFTSARLLRQRYGFKGEIRAVGAGVKQDLLFFMVRCGIDAFDLVATENLAEARQALRRFTLAYQPAVPNAAVGGPLHRAPRPRP